MTEQFSKLPITKEVVINISHALAGTVLFSNLFFWHLCITLIISDMKMPTLSLILAVSEEKIDVIPFPLDAMNYSLCFSASYTSSVVYLCTSDWQFCC